MCAERERPFRRVRLFSPLCPSREDSNWRMAILGGISQSTAQPDGFRPRWRFSCCSWWSCRKQSQLCLSCVSLQSPEVQLKIM